LRRPVLPRRKIAQDEFEQYGPEFQPHLLKLAVRYVDKMFLSNDKPDDIGSAELWTYNLLESVYRKGILDERRAAKIKV
jgi:hypothetical protein